MALRRLLLTALGRDVQKPFHHLEAARTPAEWVEREAALAEEVAGVSAPFGEWHCGSLPLGPNGWPLPGIRQSYPKNCPLCHVPTPAPSAERFLAESDHPVFWHITGARGQDACAIFGELLHYLDEVVRREKFSDQAIADARAARQRAIAAAQADTLAVKSDKPARRRARSGKH